MPFWRPCANALDEVLRFDPGPVEPAPPNPEPTCPGSRDPPPPVDARIAIHAVFAVIRPAPRSAMNFRDQPVRTTLYAALAMAVTVAVLFLWADIPWTAGPTA